jgi:nicotinamidase-related amidase
MDASISQKDARMIILPAASTALILIDLQKGIASLPTAPYSFEAVIAKGKALAQRFRAAEAPVVLVNVAFSADFADALKAPVDRSFSPPGGFPEGWSELVDGLAEPSDLRVTKHQWGAFYGTGLDLQLRRRGVTSVVIGGVATNMGVESTARAAHEHGYGVVLAEDATASFSAEMHTFAFEQIFPYLGRVAKADEIRLQA